MRPRLPRPRPPRRPQLRLPPLPVRASGRLLSPEVKAAIRKKLK